MASTAKNIAGYSYGDAKLSRSPISLAELAQLKITVAMTANDERNLKLAGQVLADQTQKIVAHWRSGIIASIPHLARHSRSLEGRAIPEYLARSNLRFEQWILDTCLRDYDQDWLNYQHQIALRHTSLMKNQIDRVSSTPYVPFRDIIAFSAVMNQTIRPYMNAGAHSPTEVEGMHQAWCKSIQLQLAMWARTYADLPSPAAEW